MELAKGKMIDIIDANHILFETDKEKIWLGTIQRFGLNLIGKEFISDMIPRYESLGLTENVEGKFKLICIKRPGKTLNSNTLFLYFKEHQTGRILEVTKIVEDVKPFILGTNYDLDLVETFKGVNPLPNVKENKTNDNELVFILNRSTGKIYLAQLGNKTISINSTVSLDMYLGKSVLIQLFRKKLSVQTNYFDNEVVSLPQSNFLFKSSINNNLLCINENEKQQQIIESESLIFSYDSGANIDMKYIPVYIGVNSSLIRTTKNKGYLLSSIINYSEKSNYLFINSADNMDKRLLYFPVDVDLENAIGKDFAFESLPLFTVSDASALPETVLPSGYLLETILNNNLYIFMKDAQKYLVEITKIVISSSKTGKYFSLDLVPVIREVQILDFEPAK